MNEDQEGETIHTKAIWLTVLKGGGRWSISEIATELGGHGDRVCRFVNQMSVRGYLRRHKTPGKYLQYSVDRSCKIPIGLAIGDLMDAGAV